jgi:hypothetical protein
MDASPIQALAGSEAVQGLRVVARRVLPDPRCQSVLLGSWRLLGTVAEMSGATMEAEDDMYESLVASANAAAPRKSNGDTNDKDGEHSHASRALINRRATLPVHEFCNGPYSRSVRDAHHSKAQDLMNLWLQKNEGALKGQMPATGKIRRLIWWAAC